MVSDIELELYLALKNVTLTARLAFPNTPYAHALERARKALNEFELVNASPKAIRIFDQLNLLVPEKFPLLEEFKEKWILK